MRVLVTGATGFVGSHLVAHLVSEGDDVSISEAEITDPEALEADFARCGRPEAVYHLAAQADVGASFDDPAATLRTNVEGTFNVLDAARRAGARRVLAVSSADAYGVVEQARLPVSETDPLRPVTPYGTSKAAAEMVCVQAGASEGPDGASQGPDGASRGLEVIRARAFNHLGPGQSDRFVAAALAARIVANERSGADVVRVGNLEARRDFTDVRDVVRAYRLLALHGRPGEAYNVCSGVSRRVGDLAESLVARARHPMRLEVDDDLLRPVEVAETRGDPSKLRQATGWRPEVPLEKTLEDLLEYWRSQPADAAPTSADAAGAGTAEGEPTPAYADGAAAADTGGAEAADAGEAGADETGGVGTAVSGR